MLVMGVMKFKIVKFLEYLVVIIIDCGDKLFFVFYIEMYSLMGKWLKVLM